MRTNDDKSVSYLRNYNNYCYRQSKLDECFHQFICPLVNYRYICKFCKNSSQAPLTTSVFPYRTDPIELTMRLRPHHYRECYWNQMGQ